MTLEIKIVGQRGKDSSKGEAHVHPFKTASGIHFGLVALSHPFLSFNTEFHPFLNDTFGTAMNQNVTFGGTPENIHNGVDNVYWTGSALSGTWDFLSTTNPQTGTRCIDATSTANNNEALFTNSGLYADIDPDDFVALTGGVRLENFVIGHEVQIRFRLEGADVGNFVNIYDFVDTGVIDSYQNFVIPIANFSLTGSVDEFVVKTVKTSGQNPNYRLDNIRLENTGAPAVFKTTTPVGTRFHITEIWIRMEDAFDSTLANNSIPNFPIDQFLGVASLTNGIVFSRVQNGKTLLSLTLKNLGDFLATGSSLINATGNAINSGFTLLMTFSEPIIIEGNEEENFLSYAISDNLAGLTRFTSVAWGKVEV